MHAGFWNIFGNVKSSGTDEATAHMAAGRGLGICHLLRQDHALEFCKHRQETLVHIQLERASLSGSLGSLEHSSSKCLDQVWHEQNCLWGLLKTFLMYSI